MKKTVVNGRKSLSLATKTKNEIAGKVKTKIQNEKYCRSQNLWFNTASYTKSKTKTKMDSKVKLNLVVKTKTEITAKT